MKKVTACCFVGYFFSDMDETNPAWISLKKILKEQIINLIQSFKVTHFISGVDLGASQYFAESVLALKNEYPQITLECALHCEEQAINWPEQQRDKYFLIVETCDKETLLQGRHTEDCLRKRNEYMIRKSKYLLAVWNGKNDETGNAISFACSIGKHIIVVNPHTFKVSPNIRVI